MSHPVKGPGKVFGYFGGESTIKTEHKLRSISKHDKNNLCIFCLSIIFCNDFTVNLFTENKENYLLSNNFVKSLNMYFKKHK